MSAHSRKPSGRAALPRRTTRGPLDADNPLPASSSLSSPLAASPGPSRTASTTSREPNVEASISLSMAMPEPATRTVPHSEEKDFSFMLDASVYHPVSQLGVPAPFRRPFPPVPTESADAGQVLEQLEALLAACDFLGAAFLSGSLIASGALKLSNRHLIFRVLAIRYSCLELSGNALLAAQEAKALEDLGSSFYYEGLIEDDPTADAESSRPQPHHIMPFALRLQALRLQSIGFSDPRRGVSSLYDVALECRENIASAHNSEVERQTWAARLEEVGIRVVNALVEMGDLECARRTLSTMKPVHRSENSTWSFRMALICLKMGLIREAHSLVTGGGLQDSERTILGSLLAVADDDLDHAIQLLSARSLGQHNEVLTLAKQNLAVALLYKGEIERARSILNDLVTGDESFQTLTINLATIYDLTSDRSKDMKLALASKVAGQKRYLKPTRSFSNADFKL